MGAVRDLEHGSDPARCALLGPDEEALQRLADEVEVAVVVVAVVQPAPPIAPTAPWPNPYRWRCSKPIGATRRMTCRRRCTMSPIRSACPSSLPSSPKNSFELLGELVHLEVHPINGGRHLMLKLGNLGRQFVKNTAKQKFVLDATQLWIPIDTN